MKKLFLTCTFLSFIFLSLGYGQHFIGKNKEEIKSLMSERKKEFIFTKEVDTKDWHFLKYENLDETKTMLFIISENGTCEYTRMMCDYSLLKAKEEELNRKYQYQRNLTWIDDASDEKYKYIIELERREWFFTIKTTRTKK